MGRTADRRGVFPVYTSGDVIRPRSRVCSPAALACILLAAFAPSLWAQQVDGNLEGRVLDADGQPLADVSVSVSSPSLQGTRGTASDRGGCFRLEGLPVGLFQIQLSHVA